MRSNLPIYSIVVFSWPESSLQLTTNLQKGEYKCWNGLEWNGLLEWLERSKFCKGHGQPHRKGVLLMCGKIESMEPEGSYVRISPGVDSAYALKQGYTPDNCKSSHLIFSGRGISSWGEAHGSGHGEGKVDFIITISWGEVGSVLGEVELFGGEASPAPPPPPR